MSEFLEFLQSPLVIVMEVLILIVIFLCLLKWLMQGGKYTKNTSAEGKVVIVTGANSGIGKETARELARRGATVYMACRDMEKCEKVRKSIITETGNKRVFALKLDLASLTSVREFVQFFERKEQQLDILINNAGIMGCPRMLTEDGFEMQLGVNHMGHFLLTNLLLDLLKKSAPSRIVVVSSMSHAWGEIKKHDLNSEQSYNPSKAYYQSKLANVLFTQELSRRLTGSQVTVNALHPGVVETEIVRHLGNCINFILSFGFKFIIWPLTKTPKNGAHTTIYAALDPDLDEVTGQYFSDCSIKRVGKAAQDDEMPKWLWMISEDWTKLKK